MDLLLNDIKVIVGESNILVGEDVSLRQVDWITKSTCNAAAIVRPADAQALSEVLQLCHKEGQAVVVHGGLTGLVQGTIATSDELVISLERMSSIEKIDPVGGTMTVQAGVVLQKVQEAAAEFGLLFPIDLGARGTCTIGGNIATNAGGVRVIRYGMMRQHVLGLEVVLADGTILSSMNQMLKNNAGYDLKQIFIGSEGTLGIVTRAVLSLQPQQPFIKTALMACSDFDSLTGLLQKLRKNLGSALGAFEVMWNNHYELMTEKNGRTPPLPCGYSYYVLVDCLGISESEVASQFEEAIEESYNKGLISDAVIAASESQREMLWHIREDIESLNRLVNPRFAFDVSLPIVEIPRYIDDLESSIYSCWPTSTFIVFGHLGDSNLHITVGVGSSSEEVRKAVEEIVYGPLKALGGSISAEHGIGQLKSAHLSKSRNLDEVQLMHILKGSLDPKNILNRRNLFPDST